MEGKSRRKQRTKVVPRKYRRTPRDSKKVEKQRKRAIPGTPEYTLNPVGPESKATPVDKARKKESADQVSFITLLLQATAEEDAGMGDWGNVIGWAEMAAAEKGLCNKCGEDWVMCVCEYKHNGEKGGDWDTQGENASDVKVDGKEDERRLEGGTERRL